MAMLYYLAATALGLGWMVVLSVPKLTGQFIALSPRWNVASLIIGSLVVARRIELRVRSRQRGLPDEGNDQRRHDERGAHWGLRQGMPQW